MQRATVAGHVLQNVDGGRQLEALHHVEGGIIFGIVVAVQHKTPVLVHGTAHQNGGLLEFPHHLGRGLAQVQPTGQFHEVEAGHGFVDDQAHGPLSRMGAQEHHTVMEGGLGHAGHGNQQFAFERVCHAWPFSLKWRAHK